MNVLSGFGIKFHITTDATKLNFFAFMLNNVFGSGLVNRNLANRSNFLNLR